MSILELKVSGECEIDGCCKIVLRIRLRVGVSVRIDYVVLVRLRELVIR